MTALEVSNATRAIGGKVVVDHVSLSVRDAELLTLVGPSGCGKSSLLRIIAGLDSTEDGIVRIADRDVTTVPAEGRNIGFVFQESSLFGHLRIADNVAFGLRHLPRRERGERVEEMLDLVRLSGLGRRYPHQLSGGEQQRVALARALAPRPRIVLLDEPFASLDEVLRADLGRQVVDILKTAGTAAILVTHDRREAITLGDRVAVMNSGRVEQCDTPDVVYRTPLNRFVASFIDIATFIDDGSGTRRVARPHELTISPGGPDRIERIEFLGANQRIVVRRSSGDLATVDVDRTQLRVGDACSIMPIRDDLHRVD